MSKRKTTLAELMGSDASKSISLASLPDILGEAMPELPRSPLGRHRLVRALQQRFGNNFRSLPGIKSLIEDFDKDIAFERKVAELRAIKYRGG